MLVSPSYVHVDVVVVSCLLYVLIYFMGRLSYCDRYRGGHVFFVSFFCFLWRRNIPLTPPSPPLDILHTLLTMLTLKTVGVMNYGTLAPLTFGVELRCT